MLILEPKLQYFSAYLQLKSVQVLKNQCMVGGSACTQIKYYAEDQVVATEAVNSAVDGASELVVEREDMSNSHDRELPAPVQVQAVLPLSYSDLRCSMQLDTALILPATFQN